MATAKDREEFIARFVAEYNGRRRVQPRQAGAREPLLHTTLDCLTAARALLRHARTHGNLAVQSCNGHPAQSSPTMDAREIGKLQDAWDARIEREEARVCTRIREICAQFALPVSLGGDPRGYTVKVKLPSGAYNTWGGSEEGYGVPQ